MPEGCIPVERTGVFTAVIHHVMENISAVMRLVFHMSSSVRPMTRMVAMKWPNTCDVTNFLFCGVAGML